MNKKEEDFKQSANHKNSHQEIKMNETTIFGDELSNLVEERRNWASKLNC